MIGKKITFLNYILIKNFTQEAIEIFSNDSELDGWITKLDKN